MEGLEVLLVDVTTGNAVSISGNGGPGMYDLVVEFSNYQACCPGTYDDTLSIEVVSDFGRQLSCNDTVQVSLGTDCAATITPDMLLEGSRITNADYNVHVKDANGDTIPNAMLDGDYAGQYLEVSIEHDCSGNSCWGWILVEDKLDPVLECTDVMVGCTDDTDPVFGGVPGFPFSPVGTSVTSTGPNAYTVMGLDSCGDVTLTYTDDEQVENCIGEETTSTLYAIRRGGPELLTLDTATGAELTSIIMNTTLDLVLGAQGLAVDPSTNEIYVAVNLATMFGGLPTLAIVDPNTGVLDIIGNLGDEFSGIAFNPLGDKLYGVTGGNAASPETLFEINKYDASVTLVCPTGTMGMGEAIAFNTLTDDFFHVTNENDTMQILDLNTCVGTGIDLSGTPLQGNGRRPTALVFDPTTGDFIIAESNANSPFTFFPNTDLYRVTPDGQVTYIGQRFGRVKGMGFVVNTPKISTITRTWTATDESGNSDECVQTIQVRPTTLLEVICPGDYDDIDNPALECDGGWAMDQNGHPDPSVTGFPTGVTCSNIDYSYSDYRLGICESSYKIIREWLIADWCTGQQVYCNQIIKVLDNDGPQVVCPPNDTFGVRPFECLGDAIAPNPLNYILKGGECSSIVDVEVTVKRGAPDCLPPASGVVGVTDGVIRQSNGDYLITDLPLGCSWITYKYTDACGNTSECTYDVFIEEDKKPVAVCDQHTVVTLSTTGTAKVFASTFDDGSYDNCEVDSFAVRRMSPGTCGAGIADDTQFRNYVEFCCDDAEEDFILVVFRVYDKSMNFNECMVEIKVVDKNAPVLECPPNIQVSCEYDFNDINVFGQVRMDENDREKIIINDPNNPNVGPNFNWGLDGFYYDDCQADIMYDEVDNRNDCGVGQIRRTWTVSDANTTVSCTQVITFTDFEPFDGTGIRFPADRTLNSCPTDVDPDVTGRPFIPNVGNCADLLVTYDDQVYNIVQDACYKIIRTWTVVDWCNNNLNTNKFTGTQVIKILNTEDPEFVSGIGNKTFNTVTNSNCTGIAELEVEVSDDCTPNSELVLEYKIDLDKDGDIDFEQTGDSSLTATNTYPEGTHEICWTVEDRCGNRLTECYDFTMRDGKKPTPYCRPGIVTVVMPTSGSIEIWASDFDDNSFDNCTQSGDLRFSFSSNVNDNRRTFDCDDIPNGIEESFEITVYVWDEAGNNDFCVTQVIIQDGIDDVCPDNITGNTVTVSGNIVTEDAETVEEVMVMLDGSMPGLPKYKMTDIDGEYAFPSVPADQPYKIGASRDDDHLNGVSTLDLVLIQRHLLGISSFNTPYKHIAADANNSNSVSAGDISELRKLILGHYAELPRNKSWRFVLKDFQFSDPRDPWPFEEIMELNNVINHNTSNDFIAVKTGDVSGDARPNGLIGNQVRGDKKLSMNIVEADFLAGETFDVEVSATATEIFGLQVAYQFDPEVMQLVDIQHSNGHTSDAHFGLTQLQDGLIQISWNANDGEVKSFDGAFITLTFEALEDGTVSDVFSLNTKRIEPEAYLEELEVASIELNFLGNDGKVVASSEEFELFQNQPNPFDMSTKIAFSLPRAQEASVRIFDVTGKTVHLIQGVFAKGLNEITVGKAQLSATGVLYYRLETKDQMATRKMIMIE